MPKEKKLIKKTENLLELQKDIEKRLTEFKFQTDKIQTEFESTILDLQKKGYKIDKEKIREFMQKFWHTYPTKNINEWEVAIPVFIPFNIGWFDRTEGGYNIFVINKYTKWLGEEIPTFISHEMNVPQGWQISVDGNVVNFQEGTQEKIEEKFGNHLSLVEKDRAVIKQGHEFDLIAEIIESGSLPFSPKPVLESDLRESDFTQIWDELKEKYDKLEIFEGKYSFQGEAWKTFLRYGALGIFWGMSFGKTIIGTYIFSRIDGKKALVVPTKTLQEHWQQFFKWNCPRLLNEVEIFTYQGMSRGKWNEIRKKEFILIGFDECHFLPADSFSRLGTIKAKYRFGLSATPYREDGRTNYIMALTGFPMGLDWKTIMNILGKEYHTVNVHIVKDLESKYQLVRQLYNPERRTIIFINLLDIGRRISDMFEIPMISGETKNRLELIKKSKSFVASRVLELGISIKDLEHIIEVDFLFGSRREEVQRTGRLMHSIVEGKIHDIIFTKDEIERYGKRLYGLYEKGFRYKIIPHISGIQIQKVGEKKSKKTKTIKGDLNIIVEIFDEGYFVAERKFGDIVSEFEKRGGKAERSSIFKKLDNMVRQKKIFKIRADGGYTFKQR